MTASELKSRLESDTIKVNNKLKAYVDDIVGYAVDNDLSLMVKLNESTNNTSKIHWLNEIASVPRFNKLSNRDTTVFYAVVLVELISGIGNYNLCFKPNSFLLSTDDELSRILEAYKKKGVHTNITLNTSSLSSGPTLALEKERPIYSGQVNLHFDKKNNLYAVRCVNDEGHLWTIIKETATSKFEFTKRENQAQINCYLEFNYYKIHRISSAPFTKNAIDTLSGELVATVDISDDDKKIYGILHKPTGIKVSCTKTDFFNYPFHLNDGDKFQGEVQLIGDRWKLKTPEQFNKSLDNQKLIYCGEDDFSKIDFWIFKDNQGLKYRLRKFNASPTMQSQLASPQLYIHNIQNNITFNINVVYTESSKTISESTHKYTYWHYESAPTEIKGTSLLRPFCSKIRKIGVTANGLWLVDIDALGVTVYMFSTDFHNAGIYSFANLEKVEFDLSKAFGWTNFIVFDIGLVEFDDGKTITLKLPENSEDTAKNAEESQKKLRQFYRDGVLTIHKYKDEINLLVPISKHLLKHLKIKKTDSKNGFTAHVINHFSAKTPKYPFSVKNLALIKSNENDDFSEDCTSYD